MVVPCHQREIAIRPPDPWRRCEVVPAPETPWGGRAIGTRRPSGTGRGKVPEAAGSV